METPHRLDATDRKRRNDRTLSLDVPLTAGAFVVASVAGLWLLGRAFGVVVIPK